MKKLSFLLATLSLAVVSLSGGGVALAGSTCSIGFTGPDSNNICTSSTTFKCELTNDNTIVFKNGNEQVAESGKATVTENTEGGNAVSGSATNSNGTHFTGTVTNDNVCVATVTQPAIVTPETPGKGAVTEVQQVTPAQPVAPGAGQAVAPAALPNTSASSPLLMATVIATVAGIVLAVTRFALRSTAE